MKDVIIRLIQDEDLPEVSEWFTARKWPVPPAGKMLPDTGYVAERVSDGQLLAVAWFYLTNSQVGIIDWIATNPKEAGNGLDSALEPGPAPADLGPVDLPLAIQPSPLRHREAEAHLWVVAASVRPVTLR